MLYSATATVLIAVFYFLLSARVGIMRSRHNIQAPATAGHPAFDRAYRIQLNTLEQMGIVLPLLWVATLVTPWGWAPAAIAVLWLVARIVYARGYTADPDKRITGAMMSGITILALALLAIAGVVMAWLDLK
jgi:glutathione S-transferase